MKATICDVCREDILPGCNAAVTVEVPLGPQPDPRHTDTIYVILDTHLRCLLERPGELSQQMVARVKMLTNAGPSPTRAA